ncbi:MAG: hypothetical protein ABH858_03100, partial [Candidatus Omnitrophota bacterium]
MHQKVLFSESFDQDRLYDILGYLEGLRGNDLHKMEYYERIVNPSIAVLYDLAVTYDRCANHDKALTYAKRAKQLCQGDPANEWGPQVERFLRKVSGRSGSSAVTKIASPRQLIDVSQIRNYPLIVMGFALNKVSSPGLHLSSSIKVVSKKSKSIRFAVAAGLIISLFIFTGCLSDKNLVKLDKKEAAGEQLTIPNALAPELARVLGKSAEAAEDIINFSNHPEQIVLSRAAQNTLQYYGVLSGGERYSIAFDQNPKDKKTGKFYYGLKLIVFPYHTLTQESSRWQVSLADFVAVAVAHERIHDKHHEQPPITQEALAYRSSWVAAKKIGIPYAYIRFQQRLAMAFYVANKQLSFLANKLGVEMNAVSCVDIKEIENEENPNFLELTLAGVNTEKDLSVSVDVEKEEIFVSPGEKTAERMINQAEDILRVNISSVAKRLNRPVNEVGSYEKAFSIRNFDLVIITLTDKDGSKALAEIMVNVARGTLEVKPSASSSVMSLPIQAIRKTALAVILAILALFMTSCLQKPVPPFQPAATVVGAARKYSTLRMSGAVRKVYFDDRQYPVTFSENDSVYGVLKGLQDYYSDYYDMVNAMRDSYERQTAILNGFRAREDKLVQRVLEIIGKEKAQELLGMEVSLQANEAFKQVLFTVMPRYLAHWGILMRFNHSGDALRNDRGDVIFRTYYKFEFYKVERVEKVTLNLWDKKYDVDVVGVREQVYIRDRLIANFDVKIREMPFDVIYGNIVEFYPLVEESFKVLLGEINANAPKMDEYTVVRFPKNGPVVDKCDGGRDKMSKDKWQYPTHGLDYPYILRLPKVLKSKYQGNIQRLKEIWLYANRVHEWQHYLDFLSLMMGKNLVLSKLMGLVVDNQTANTIDLLKHNDELLEVLERRAFVAELRNSEDKQLMLFMLMNGMCHPTAPLFYKKAINDILATFARIAGEYPRDLGDVEAYWLYQAPNILSDFEEKESGALDPFASSSLSVRAVDDRNSSGPATKASKVIILSSVLVLFSVFAQAVPLPENNRRGKQNESKIIRITPLSEEDTENTQATYEKLIYYSKTMREERGAVISGLIINGGVFFYKTPSIAEVKRKNPEKHISPDSFSFFNRKNGTYVVIIGSDVFADAARLAVVIARELAGSVYKMATRAGDDGLDSKKVLIFAYETAITVLEETIKVLYDSKDNEKLAEQLRGYLVRERKLFLELKGSNQADSPLTRVIFLIIDKLSSLGRKGRDARCEAVSKQELENIFSVVLTDADFSYINRNVVEIARIIKIVSPNTVARVVADAINTAKAENGNGAGIYCGTCVSPAAVLKAKEELKDEWERKIQSLGARQKAKLGVIAWGSMPRLLNTIVGRILEIEEARTNPFKTANSSIGDNREDNGNSRRFPRQNGGELTMHAINAGKRKDGYRHQPSGLSRDTLM